MSSFSGFRPKSTTYGALASSGLRSSYIRKMKCALKFASEQYMREAKKKTDLKDKGFVS